MLDVAGTESGSSGPSNFAADPGGDLYFTGGSTLYEVQGSTHTLATVDSLESAVGDLVFDQSGNLFGIAGGSGADKYGTVVEVVAGTRQLRTLATFDKTNGVYPNSLVCDARGNLYGLTENIQGLAGATAFEVPAGSESATTIASFGGSLSPNSLFVGPGGDLFGTTLQGGAFDEGALFEINPEARTLSTLYNFRTPTSANFSDLLFDNAGDIFGTLQNSVFEIAAGTHSFTVLEGTAPGQLTGDIASQLYADSAGNLYFAASASNLASTGAIFEMASTGFVTSPSAPVVFTQPSAVETLAGRAASFTAVRNSTPAPSVQWQSSADGGKTFTNIAGNPTATTQTLTLSSVDRSQSGTEYRAVFTNSLGTTASKAATLSIVPMVVVTPAHASPNVVTSNSTTLTALGNSATGENGLTYNWRVVASPPGAPKPTFSADGTAAAGRSTVTFAKAGYYRFRCTISDGKGDTVASDVSVRVEQQAMSLRMSPHHSSVAIGQSITIHAAEYDQFGHPLQNQPAPSFSIETGPGTINATTGVFSSALIGTDLIEATDDDLSGTVGLQVIPS